MSKSNSYEISKADLRTLACHEAGHGLIHALFDKEYNDKRLISLSIVPQNRPLVISWTLTKESEKIFNLERFERDIVALMGGFAAETVKELEPSIFVSLDMQKAIGIARNIEKYFRKAEAAEMDDELISRTEKLITRLKSEAIKIITTHKKALDAITEELMIKKILDGDEVRRIIEENPPS